MTLLMEDLIVLAVGLKPKAGPNTGVLPLQFQYGVRGAELVTLTMAGRVTVGNGRIEVRDATPLPDPLPNLALSQLVASGGAELGSWMTNTPSLYLTNYFERLRTAGALSDVRVWLLYIARRTGYLVVDQNYFRDVCMRLHAAVMSPGPIDAAQAALAGLVHAAGLAKWAYPGAANAAVRDRLKQLAEGNPASAASASAASASAGPGTRGVPVNDDPNRWFNEPAGGIGTAAIEAAVRSATEAAVHAVVSSVTEAVHAASDASAHSHHGGGSGSSDSSPSHHHG
jgi:Golgi phosphoprotein 3 (GPP34)